MAQDLRELFKNEKHESEDKLQAGHKLRFEEKLYKQFGSNSSNKFLIIKIAAILILAIGAGTFLYLQNPVFNNGNSSPVIVDVEDDLKEDDFEKPKSEIQLSEISPEFKKIEDYYMASINIELSKININPGNKALIDAFMQQLAGLDKEYKLLNSEFLESGTNEQTIEAMVNNLQMRLELLLKLKNKLNEIKIQQHENSSPNAV